MKKSKALTVILSIIIIIILIVVLVVINVNNLNQDKNLNELNIQNNINVNNTNKTNNTLENNNSENQILNTIIEENQEITNLEYVTGATKNLNLGSDNMNNQSEEIKINLIVNNKTFTATLNNNETVRQLVSMFPMTLNMSDLHSNEKYNYLDTTLTTDSNRSGRINAGDIKLYGNDCLVVFYESFSNSYSYTDLGRVDNVDAFVSELGSGSVDIRFELVN